MRKVHQRYFQALSHAGHVGQSWIPSFKDYLNIVCAIMQAFLFNAPYCAFTSSFFFFVLEVGVTLFRIKGRSCGIPSPMSNKSYSLVMFTRD